MTREFDGNLALMNGTLDIVDSPAAIECVLQFAAKYRHGKVVDQEDCPEETSKMNAAVVEWLTPCGGAKARKRLHSCAMATLHGRGNAYKVIPDSFDGVESDVAIGDRRKIRRYQEIDRDMQAAVA